MLAFTPLGQLEGIVQDAVDTVSAEYGLLQYHFPIRAAELAAADIRVLAFGILAHHQEIDIARLLAGERTGDARHQSYGPQVDVLVEVSAEAQQRSPQRYMVGHHFRPADRTKQNRIESLQAFIPVGGHHLAVLQVVVSASPVEVFELQIQPVALA